MRVALSCITMFCIVSIGAGVYSSAVYPDELTSRDVQLASMQVEITYIKGKVDKIEDKIDDIHESVICNSNDLSALQARMGVIGLIAGAGGGGLVIGGKTLHSRRNGKNGKSDK